LCPVKRQVRTLKGTAIITEEIKSFIRKQKLGFVATVCPDGTPNLSPKGTTTVWDDEHLVFADIHSPGTIENLLKNPSVEINVVDIFNRKGYRFKGRATVITEGAHFQEIIRSYGEAALKYKILSVVLVKVDRILPLMSPVYDTGATEEDVVKRWKDYWNSWW